MKKLVLLFLFSSFGQIIAQQNDYIPMLQNTRFTYENGWYDQNVHKEVIYLKDTIANNNTYKVYSFYYEDWGFGSKVYFREDANQRKVWQAYMYQDQAEDNVYDFLMYDFSLQLNDTINGNMNQETGVYYYVYVSNIDEVATGNGMAKRWTITTNNHSLIGNSSSWHDYAQSYIWVEGIGNIYHFAEATFPDLSYWGEGNLQMVCAWKNEQFIFGSCDTLLAIENVQTEKLFSISPNPVDTELNIIADTENLNNTWCRIYNTLGEEVFYTKTSAKIQLPPLAAGIYVLCIIDKNGKTIYTQKLMKEN
ncbi:MAG: T9SS type A sorting domain-containing protein [Chitinophagales bacterium]|nr:T9SS type A sorting domain-containing protein [Bacteroidota bacterium]